MKDGKREKMDMKLNKRILKTYDMASLLRIDIEFPMKADFVTMK